MPIGGGGDLLCDLWVSRFTLLLLYSNFIVCWRFGIAASCNSARVKAAAAVSGTAVVSPVSESLASSCSSMVIYVLTLLSKVVTWAGNVFQHNKTMWVMKSWLTWQWSTRMSKKLRNDSADAKRYWLWDIPWVLPFQWEKREQPKIIQNLDPISHLFSLQRESHWKLSCQGNLATPGCLWLVFQPLPVSFSMAPASCGRHWIMQALVPWHPSWMLLRRLYDPNSCSFRGLIAGSQNKNNTYIHQHILYLALETLKYFATTCKGLQRQCHQIKWAAPSLWFLQCFLVAFGISGTPLRRPFCGVSCMISCNLDASQLREIQIPQETHKFNTTIHIHTIIIVDSMRALEFSTDHPILHKVSSTSMPSCGSDDFPMAKHAFSTHIPPTFTVAPPLPLLRARPLCHFLELRMVCKILLQGFLGLLARASLTDNS